MAAKAAVTRPAASNHIAAVAHPGCPFRKNIISTTKADTKKTIGNGTIIEWIGWPIMLDVLLGFGKDIADHPSWIGLCYFVSGVLFHHCMSHARLLLSLCRPTSTME